MLMCYLYEDNAAQKPQKHTHAACLMIINCLQSLHHRKALYLLFDELPDDASHLISVHLHHRLVHLDALCGIWKMYSYIN